LPRHGQLQPTRVGDVFERLSIDLTGPHPNLDVVMFTYLPLLIRSASGASVLRCGTKKRQLLPVRWWNKYFVVLDPHSRSCQIEVAKWMGS